MADVDRPTRTSLNCGGDPGRTRSRHRRRGWTGASALIATTLAAGMVAFAPISPSSAAARPSVAIEMLPTQRVAAGGTAQYPFVVSSTGRVGSLSFETAGLPAGATADVQPLGNRGYELDVHVAQNAPAAKATIILRVRSRAKLRSVAVYLEISPAAVAPGPPQTSPPPTNTSTTQPVSQVLSFGLRADNPEIVVGAGRTAAFGISVDRSGGYGGDVTFSASGLPAATTANFAPNPTRAGTVLYVTPSAATPDGRYQIAVLATAADARVQARTTTMVVNVQNRPDFALDVPATITMAPGTSSNTLIGYRPLTVASATTSLSIAGLPTGSSAQFVPNPTFGPTTLLLSVPSSAVVGTYPLVVTASNGIVTHLYPVTLSVVGVGGTGGYGLTAAPAVLTIARGTSGSFTVTITPTVGFSGAITFTVAGLPALPSISASGTSINVILTVAVPVGTVPGTYPLTVTGTSGTLSASVVVTLTIT